MAHNSYIRGSLGAWGIASTLTPAELWAFDQAQFRAVNGDDGGAYAPTSAITIGGSGLTLNGANHAVGGTLTINSGGFVTVASGGVANVAGTLNVQAGATLAVASTGTMTFTGGGSVDTYLRMFANSSIQVYSGALVSMLAGSQMSFNATATLALNGTTTQSGTGSFINQGLISNASGGRITKRIDTNATDGNRTIAVTTADVFYNPSGVLSASRAWTLTNGTNVGEEITLVNLDATYSITIAGSIQSVTGGIKNASGSFACASFVWNGTHWVSTSATAV